MLNYIKEIKISKLYSKLQRFLKATSPTFANHQSFFSAQSSFWSCVYLSVKLKNSHYSKMLEYGQAGRDSQTVSPKSDEQKPWWWDTMRKQETQRQSPRQHMFYSRRSVFFDLLLMTNSFLCVDREVTSHFKGGYMILIECSNYRTCKTYLFCHQYMWHVMRTNGALR